MVIQLPQIHAGQREVAKSNARFKVLVCGRRWGKTRFGSLFGFKKMLEQQRVWWVAPTYQQTNIAWRLVRSLARKVPDIHVSLSDKCLIYGKGEFWFKSADRPDNLRGEGLDHCIFDESAYQEEFVWTEVLRPALADRKGGATFISTPSEERGWFRLLYERGQDPKEVEWESWQKPSHTNPYLDPAEIEEARKLLPSIVFRREFLAEFVSAEGARVKREWLKYGTPPENLTLAIGVDLAISLKENADYTAIVVGGFDVHGFFWVVDVHRARVTFHEAIRLIASMAEKYKVSVIGVESVAYQEAVAQELLRLTKFAVKSIKVSKDKMTRFQPVEARYEQGMVKHAKGLPREFEQELLGFPLAEHADMIDALVHCFNMSPQKTGLLSKLNSTDSENSGSVFSGLRESVF